MNKNLIKSLEKLFERGTEKTHVVSDFDGTLNIECINGKKIPSVISVLRDTPNYLNKSYQSAALELFNTYSPFENDLSLSIDQRKEKMKEWWVSHYELLIRSGLNISHLEKVVTSGIIELREGVEEFLEMMNDKKIPVIIFSASGLGEAIPLYFKYRKLNCDNILFVINKFVWDKKGNAVDYLEPIIHSLNKDETILDDIKMISKKIKNRNNVLLLGNNPGDIEMITGQKVDSSVSVGFLDDCEKEKSSQLEKYFNFVSCNGLTEINKLLKKVL